MSELLEPGAVYRALQEVSEGKDPAEAYQALLADAVDPEELVMEQYFDDVAEQHSDEACREKAQRGSFCHGSACQYLPGGIRIQADCPCNCHEWENE
ncbi:hypothetical protein SEA_BAUER_81 [Arthrobacter phage Bauer]|uniref:Uncharacterized protein n=1 Tax=Arthrobacter phage Bauer TaxID=2985648 RepID=A0A9E8AAU9_9CAUD|nr:hypothetical protein QEO99_gp81 [Arthrobacter phage Bauer]UYM26630.1 hypothetical protein SEA_BAUER_81 [Arthrobacter phage Bauer]